MDSRATLLAACLAAAFLLAGCTAGDAGGGPRGPARTETLTIDVGGQPAVGLLGVPPQPPTTLLVLAHGWAMSAEDYRADVQRLAEAGVLAVAMEFRGDRQDYKVRTGVEDTVAATLALQQRYPSVDRTLLYGYSMGGEVALLAPAHAPPGTYDYVFVGAGVTDLRALWNSHLHVRPFVERETGGTPDQAPGEYSARSPVDRAADLRDKGVQRVFLVHGAGDGPVLVEQAERMYDGLARAGVPVSYYVVTKNREAWVCTPLVILCMGSTPTGVANHEAGLLHLMRPFIDHRIARLPDPVEPAVRGTYDGEAGSYEPSDVGP